MGISTTLAFGIPLTDEFGGVLQDVPPAVLEYATAEKEETSWGWNTTYKSGVIDLDTADDTSLLIGVLVPGEDPDQHPGLDLGDGGQVQALNEKYQAVISALPADVREGLVQMGRAPKLCVLRGHD